MENVENQDPKKPVPPAKGRPKNAKTEKVQGLKSERAQVILTHPDGRVERRTI